MANRDDYRGYRSPTGREPWRREGPRQGAGRGGEPRSFGEEGRFNSDQARYGEDEPWRRERYGSRFDQDRAGYGSGFDRQRGEYGRGQQAENASQYGANYGGGYESGYGGQEYGIEAGANRQGEQYGAPQDYADRSREHRGHDHHEFDADYLHWREEQLRVHDRDYQDWRRHQQQQHDEEYRKFRAERRDTFGRNFLDWRSQRKDSAEGGTPPTSEFAATSSPVQAVADGEASKDKGKGKDEHR